MQNTSTRAELTFAIQLLEVEHAHKEQQLKLQFHRTYESLKPVNILKNTFNDITSSTSITDSILGAVMGGASGFLSKKIAVGSSHNIFKKILGSVIQVGVSSVVSSHPETIKMVGQFLYQHLFRKKESKNTEL